MTSNYQRDRATQRTVVGVRLNPTHWASVTVHAFRQWTGAATLQTWCGITADLEDGARQTTDLISCTQCSQASWKALRS